MALNFVVNMLSSYLQLKFYFLQQLVCHGITIQTKANALLFYLT